jgi:hypothetical protein
MRRHALVSTRVMVTLMMLGAPALVAGQTKSAASPAPAAKTASSRPPSAPQLRTSWGDPDLQGLWSNSTTTPLERPAAYTGKEFLTETEAKALDAAQAVANDQRASNATADVNAAYNQFWWERGATLATRRTSLIIEPSDGKIPPLTPEGRDRVAAVRAATQGVPRGPEDRNLAERCVTRGAPKLPGGYNNNFQIFQTPEYVAIVQEMIHEVRIIPLDRRPHLPSNIRQYMGDSRGHWEGSTLIVDITNYHNDVMFNSYNCCPGAGGNLHIVERYTRTEAGTIDFSFTVEDEKTYTKKFVVAVPMTQVEGPMYEYACHEGNYGMDGILRGARAQEKANGEGAR